MVVKMLGYLVQYVMFPMTTRIADDEHFHGEKNNIAVTDSDIAFISESELIKLPM